MDVLVYSALNEQASLKKQVADKQKELFDLKANASAGIGTAYAASSPILIVSGQIERDHIGKERGKLHEIKDLSSTISSVTKHNELILDPKRIPQALHKAFA